MSIFGDSWRVTHVAAALLISATLFLMAEWAIRQFEGSRWHVSASTFAVLLLGTNLTLVQFGPIAQAYAGHQFGAFNPHSSRTFEQDRVASGGHLSSELAGVNRIVKKLCVPAGGARLLDHPTRAPSDSD